MTHFAVLDRLAPWRPLLPRCWLTDPALVKWLAVLYPALPARDSRALMKILKDGHHLLRPTVWRSCPVVNVPTRYLPDLSFTGVSRIQGACRRYRERAEALPPEV